MLRSIVDNQVPYPAVDLQHLEDTCSSRIAGIVTLFTASTTVEPLCTRYGKLGLLQLLSCGDVLLFTVGTDDPNEPLCHDAVQR